MALVFVVSRRDTHPRRSLDLRRLPADRQRHHQRVHRHAARASSTQAIHLIPGHWLLGVGPGLYGTLNPDPANPVYYAHNVWLDETVELGVAGGLALIAVFLLAMRSAFRRKATLGFSLLAAFIVANLFDDVLYFPRNGILLAAAFAVAAAGDGLSVGPRSGTDAFRVAVVVRVQAVARRLVARAQVGDHDAGGVRRELARVPVWRHAPDHASCGQTSRTGARR